MERLRRQSRRGQHLLASVLVLMVILGLSGLRLGVSTPAGAQAFTATLEVSPARAKVGETVEIRGSDYPAEAEVELVWYTVEGRYEIEQRSEFVGQRYEPVSQVLTTTRSDEFGTISATLEVPLGFGGPHDLRGRVKGQELSQAGLMVLPTLTMTPSEGPVGTPIEVRIAGVDLRSNLNTWHVLYDNDYLGFMSAVTTDGVAVARFRASGPVGTHRIQLWRNSYNSTPYLAADTGPFAGEFAVGTGFDFEVTGEPEPIAPIVDDFSAADDPWPLEVTVAGPGTLALSVDRGPVGQPTTLTGSDLPPDAELTLYFSKMVGNRVSAIGFSEEMVDLGVVQTGPDGTFVKELTIPDDLGGYHRLEVVKDGQTLAATGLMIVPSLVSISPMQVRAGEEIEIHLKGVGWTTYDNTYAVTYDNSYMGYVCGFSTNGDVVFRITAVGGPGTHIIDLYPAIYKGQDAMPKTYAVPQLTYADDHPGRPLPAIRLSVEIVA